MMELKQHKMGMCSAALVCLAQAACGSPTWVSAEPDQIAYVWKEARGVSGGRGFKDIYQGPYRDHYLPHQNRKFINITKAWVLRSELVPAQASNNTSVDVRAHIVVRPKVAPEYEGWFENTKRLVDTYGPNVVKITDNQTPEGRSGWYDRGIKDKFREYVAEEVGKHEALRVVSNARRIANTVKCRISNYLSGNHSNSDSYVVVESDSADGAPGADLYVIEEGTGPDGSVLLRYEYGSCAVKGLDNSLFDVLTVDIGEISLSQKVRDAVVREVALQYDAEIAVIDVELEKVKADVRALQAQQATTLANIVQPELTDISMTYERLKVFQGMTCDESLTIVIQTDANGLPIVDGEQGIQVANDG